MSVAAVHCEHAAGRRNLDEVDEGLVRQRIQRREPRLFVGVSAVDVSGAGRGGESIKSGLRLLTLSQSPRCSSQYSSGSVPVMNDSL